MLDVFVSEFNQKNHPKTDSDSYNNIRKLLLLIAKVVERSENRKPHMKKVNIFTLNYDNVVESILKELGLFHLTLSTNCGNENGTGDIVGFNVTRNEFIPSFLVTKVHGSIDNDGLLKKEDVILPNREKKISSALSQKFFKLLFRMKIELEKSNSVLFIIGYSGRDEDINEILSQAVSSGLTVYWLKYNDKDDGLEKLKLAGLKTINSKGKDSTQTLSCLLEGIL